MEPSASSCPQHILNYIEERLHHTPIIAVEECKSAQQQVWIVQLDHHQINGWNDMKISNDDFLWKDCLVKGNGRLVIRQWKGGCQWWNLNQNASPNVLAKMELQGYQWSYQTLRKKKLGSSTVVIPRLLYSEEKSSALERRPWAILEYVGPHSHYFDDKNTTFDSSWMENMVQTRFEFGSDEPHPRWGRVPEPFALDYATMVMKQVIIPLHLASTEEIIKNHTSTSTDTTTTQTATSDPFPVRTYQSMIAIYQQAYEKILQRLVALQYHSPDAMTSQDQTRWNQVLELLGEAVNVILPANLTQIPDMVPSFVLVHLDLQPQNLLFSNHGVAAVLDWEDAAIADPRFELLMLGRKVCANRNQAESIWKRYAEEIMTVQSQHQDRDSRSQVPDVVSRYVLGPLLPWLQLETTHSLLTLLLQSMNMLNGGRNPWETSTDLWGKLERESARWNDMKNEAASIPSHRMKEEESSSPSASDNDNNNEGSSINSHKGNDDNYFAMLGIHPDECYRTE